MTDQMNHQISSYLIKLLIGLLALSLGQQVFANDCSERKNINLTIPVGNFTELRINALAGEFFLEAGDDDQIAVNAVACTDKIEYLNRMKIEVDESDNILELTVIIPYNDKDWHARYAHIDLSIEVPATLVNLIRDSSGDLEAKGVTLAQVEDSSGNIRLRDTKGNLTLRDSSGDVYIREHQGNLTLEDSAGDLEISEVTGDLRIKRDSSGDIEIEAISGLVTIDRDSSGDIEIEQVGQSVNVAADGSGSITIKDVRGSVEIGVDGSGNVAIQTVDGDFTLLSKGSGNIRTSNVKGTISIPN